MTNTEQRIEHVKGRIADMERAIGRAYLRGDNDGIGYYTMHAKAYGDELEELEKVAEEERASAFDNPAIAERCMAILKAVYHQCEQAEERVQDMAKRHGDESSLHKVASKRANDASAKYRYQCAFAATLLGMDMYDLMREVEA